MKKRFGFGMLVMVLVFVMAVVGCDDDTGSGGGYLTITDIPERHNGSFVFFSGRHGESVALAGFQSFDAATETATLPRVSGGRVTFPIWTVDWNYTTGRFENPVRFSGNATTERGFIEFYSSSTGTLTLEGGLMGGGRSLNDITFRNGNATVVWNDIQPELGAEPAGPSQ